MIGVRRCNAAQPGAPGKGESKVGYSLEEFCDETRTILAQEGNAQGRDKVRSKLETLLKDEAFIAAYCGPNAEPGIRTVYRCPETQFNVLVHIYVDGKFGPPHDHGDSWAIYGQAAGHTIMTTWQRMDDGSEDGKARIEEDQTFRLDPGMAGKFEPKQIHSIHISDGSRFVRVTGTDLNTIETLVFNPEEETVKVGNRL